MMRNRIKFFTALIMTIAFLLMSFTGITTVRAEDDSTLYISSVDEFLEFAQQCTLDSFSKGLSVKLTKSIDLNGVEFSGIAYFAGDFDGNGKTISGLNVEREGKNIGLFRTLAGGSSVSNLNIEGTITAGGDGENVGAVAGLNEGTITKCSFSGTITGLVCVGGIAGYNSGAVNACSFSGKIQGEHKVGGIAGKSTGTITLCENSGDVNVDAVTSTSSDITSELDRLINDIASISTEDILNITDIGGIVGNSSGVIAECTNSGTVGYIHVGYNVGGIAGLTSGYIEGCSSSGTVYGRNDVGGICGQLEPYAVWDLSESNITRLEDLFKTLKSQAEGISGSIGQISENVSSAASQVISGVNSLSSEFENTVSEVKDGVNEKYNSVVNTIKKLKEIDALPDLEIDVEGEITAESIRDITLNGGIDVDSMSSQELIVILEELEDELKISMPDTTDLTNSLLELRTALKSLVNSFSGAENLSDQISALASTVDNIMELGISTVEEGGLSDDYLQDISVKNARSQKTGSTAVCLVSGTVNGDTNVGGICGTMDFELSFDLENSLNITDLLMGNAKYQVFAVVRDSCAEPDVIAKKACAGGAVGLSSFGAIVSCETSGSVKSEKGNHAGGIAGNSKGTIVDSYARTSLCSESYVGGIAGEAVNLSGCVAFSQIDCSGGYVGSVAGNATGSYESNYGVESEIGAIDGVSFEGKAENISFAQMKELSGLPENFKKITVTFVDEDGVEIETVETDFGGSVKAPKRENNGNLSWKWDDFDREDVRFCITVSGHWTSPIKTIADSDEHPTVLAEGEFYEENEIEVKEYDCQLPDSLKLHRSAGTYDIKITDFDGSCKIRLYAPNENTELYLVSLSDDGNIENVIRKIDYTADGSYAVFDASFESGNITVLEIYRTKADLTWLYIVIGAVVLVGAAVVVILVVKKKRKNGK